MVAFRVASDCGIGHLVRCKWLANALQTRGQRVLFILDGCDESSQSFVAQSGVSFVQLERALSEQDDARQCVALLEQYSEVTQVVLDHYELSICWERIIRSAGYELMALDDIAREHVADWVVDPKWSGPNPERRYKDKVPETSQLLLGPDYALLAPDYAQSNHDEPRQPRILFSLGGGGDLTLLAELIRPLLAIPELSNVMFDVVVGPQAKNVEHVYRLSSARVVLIEQPASLEPYYRRCGFFVGALGTSLYELAATATPALTFAMAPNQQNDTQALEALGHFFHLDSLPPGQLNQAAQTIATLYRQRGRVSALRQHPAVSVDGLGAGRLAEVLVSGTTCTNSGLSVQDNTDSLLPVAIYARHDLRIRPVCDRDINAYVQARNSEHNAGKMPGAITIDRIEHYHWWFNNNRQSFVLEQDGCSLLYIWHQSVQRQGVHYWYGGWFTVSEAVPFNIAILALKWQLDATAALQPRSIWLAVIHKDNKFVNLLNKHMGFQSTKTNSELFAATQSLFPNASDSEFNFVHKYPDV